MSGLSSVRSTRLLVRALLGLWSLVCALSVGDLHAAPLLKVRASAHFSELRAISQGDARVEVQGTLLDDVDQPVPNAVVTLPSALAARGCDDNPVIMTDHQGKFCAQVEHQGGATRVVFLGDNLLSETSAVVETLPAESVPLSVNLETQREWSRAAPQHVVSLTLNEDQELFAAVSLHREGAVLYKAEPATFAGKRSVVEIGGASLPAAGPLTIVADIVRDDGSLVTQAQLGIDLVSVIRLELSQKPADDVRTGDDLPLSFTVTGDLPAVDSGWVELWVDGTSVAMAPVHQGSAQIDLTLTAARQRTSELRAVFVPQFHYHTAAEPLTWTITVLGPRRWLHVPLALLLLGFTWHIARMWRRPARESTRATPPQRAGIPGVVRSEPRASIDGWQGVVRDAHTGAPIAGATVALAVPSIVPVPPPRQSVTAQDGSFRFDKLTPLPEGSRLIVHARHHSSLDYSAPQPGSLDISLVARRRTLLAAIRDWKNRGADAARPEPTPLELAHQALQDGDHERAEWIRLVDAAIHGPDPVESTTEAALLGRRPARAPSSAKGR